MATHQVVLEVSIVTSEQDGTPEQTAEMWQGIVEGVLLDNTAADRVYVRVTDYYDKEGYIE